MTFADMLAQTPEDSEGPQATKVYLVTTKSTRMHRHSQRPHGGRIGTTVTNGTGYGPVTRSYGESLRC